jgi:hypothetical protein
MILPPVIPTMIPHDLHPLTNKKWMCAPTTAAASPPYNIIEPDNECCNRPMPWSSNPPHRSIRIINMSLTGKISIQAMHHIVTLEAIKVATNLQWSGPIIDIKEHCCGVVRPNAKHNTIQEIAI